MYKDWKQFFKSAAGTFWFLTINVNALFVTDTICITFLLLKAAILLLSSSAKNKSQSIDFYNFAVSKVLLNRKSLHVGSSYYIFYLVHFIFLLDIFKIL